MLAPLIATIPHADPLPQPAPTWLLWGLLMLTFFLHLLAMNWTLGGSIIGAVTRMTSAPSSPGRSAVKMITKSMPATVAATVTLGVAPLLFIQVLYGRMLFTSSILMGWFWFSVIPLLVIGYYATYMLSMKGERLGSFEGPVSWIAALAFIVIGFLYSNNMTLMLNSQEFYARYLQDGRGLQLNLGDPTLIPRYLHMLLGAIAVAGMVLALWGIAQRAKDAELGSWAMKAGTRWFVLPTVLNVITGFWWMFQLPRETMLRFMGQSTAGTLWFGIGFVLAIGTLIMMFMAMVKRDPAGLIRGSAGSLLLTLVAMVFMRDQVRRGALEAAGFEPTPWVEPQWGVIALFFLLLLVSFGTVGWMTWVLFRGDGSSASVKP